MNTCQYKIEGTSYDENINVTSAIVTFTEKFNFSIEIEKTENGFILEIEATKEDILDFEPQLFRKIANLMEIKLYTKKETKPSKNDINENKIFKSCAQLLRQEKIIGIKGDNCFHLICNAAKAKSVTTLRDLISQPDRPLPVMYKNIQKAKNLFIISQKEEALLESENKPFVIAKLRTLHRLEKVKYKHKLTPLINTVNQRVALSLTHNKLYEKLFNEIDFPLVSIDTSISKQDELLKKYGDSIEYILDSDEKIEEVKARELLQIIYGKTQNIKTKANVEKKVDVYLDYKEDRILNFKFKPLKIIDDNEPKHKALSLLFSKLSVDKVLELELPFKDAEIKKLYKNWESSTTYSNLLLDLFDAIASLSGELHQKSFVEQSVMLAEAHYEVCEEDLFDFEIVDNEIDIDIVTTYLKNNKLKHLGSTLVNTISTIITQIVKEQSLEEVILTGNLFNYRDLSELTIEKLEDEDIKAVLS